MATARWDFTWQQGGSWRRRFRRLDRQGHSLGITGPCRIELRKTGDTDDKPPVETITAVLDPANEHADVTVTPEIIARHAGKILQHKVIDTDPLTSLPRVFIRGYVTVVNRSGG